MPTARPPFQISRRSLLGAGLGGAALLVLSACTPTPRFIEPTASAVGKAEAARRSTGKLVKVTLNAAPGAIDLAGTTAKTWSYGTIPGPIIRCDVGDQVQATLANALPDASSIHWHGLALRNDMDGVPGLTQTMVDAGSEFTYDFVAPHSGTHWFHPHVGAQLDSGLYGAIIVADPNEPGDYDAEWVVVLDDWLDGVTSTPEDVLKEVSAGMGGGMDGMDGMGDEDAPGGAMRMGNMLMGASSDLLGGDAGDIFYPTYLINGRPAADPETFTSTPGKRVRIRLINAGGDTAFRVALTGHKMTVTHTDGFEVEPYESDAVLIGMGERYDVIVTLGDGAFSLVSSAEGKGQQTRAIVRTGGGDPPGADAVPTEFTGRVATADQLRGTSAVALSERKADRTLTITLTGSMMGYDWALDGKPYDFEDPLKNAYPLSEGERVELTFVNDTMMWHPMHLHGHTYQHAGGGPRKDTSIVLPGKSLTVAFDADNPGRWLTHCHNIYHAESGMMGVFAYQS